MDWRERYATFRHAFAEAMDPRLYNLDYLNRLLSEGRAGIWFSDNAAIVAEIRVYPTGAKAVCGVIAAGAMDEIVSELIPQAEAWGREQGCTLALIESRPGWARAMREHGYGTHQVSIIKEL